MLMGPARASTLQSRAAERSLAHGGRLSEACALFPSAPQPWVDLSTGINPVPYPVPQLSLTAFTRLPEPDAIAALERAAAEAYGVGDPTLVAAIPGSQMLISLLPRLFPLRHIAVHGPTYGEHSRCWAATGTHVHEMGALPELRHAAGAVLCNPNNPDGRRFAPDQLIALAESFAGRGGMMIVDEAFADLERPPLSLAPHLPLPGVVILRSFGKAYGLAGLRLGFALADAPTMVRIRAALGPWPISGAAVEIGRKALSDQAWLTETADRRAQDAARLDALLARADFTLIGGTRLFRLAQSPQAGDVFNRLGRAGIYVRRFDAHKNWLRFGLPGDETQWQRLAAAFC